jgi:hypothetical protein
LAIGEALLDDQVFPLDIPLFREATPKNIEMGAPRTGATHFKPADARGPDHPLRRKLLRWAEQRYTEHEKRHAAPQSYPAIHGIACLAGCARTSRDVMHSTLIAYSMT